MSGFPESTTPTESQPSSRLTPPLLLFRDNPGGASFGHHGPYIPFAEVQRERQGTGAAFMVMQRVVDGSDGNMAHLFPHLEASDCAAADTDGAPWMSDLQAHDFHAPIHPTTDAPTGGPAGAPAASALPDRGAAGGVQPRDAALEAFALDSATDLLGPELAHPVALMGCPQESEAALPGGYQY